MKKVLFLWFAVICSAFCPQRLFGQNYADKNPLRFITVKPQSFLFGANVGTEIAMSSKTSVGGEVTGHFWPKNIPSNMAIAPIFKYYLRGTVGQGLYARAKLVGGYYFKKTAIDNQPYYAGGGVGFGGITSLCKAGRIHLFVDVGVKFVPSFGNRPNSNISGAEFGMVYYAICSPASMPEFAVGVAFRL